MTRRRTFVLGFALAALAALMVFALFQPRAAAAGWLIAFIYLSAIPIGSLALLLIHRLTGGDWGDALRPVLEPAAACIPLLAVLFVPIVIVLPVLYPWVGGAGEIKPDVGILYLNIPLFILRAVIAFFGWSVLALMLPRVGGRSGTLLAALGLIFHAVIICLVSIDWILSAEPAFVSTSFGASMAIMQLLAALGFAAIAAPLPNVQAVRDLSGLMLAVTLGLTYIDFMAVLVIWYGDLPHKIDWFLPRIASPWIWLAVAAFILCSVLPVLALLLTRVRASQTALRAVAFGSLAGLALYVIYLLAAPYGAWTLLTAPIAAFVLCAALTLSVDAGWPGAVLRRTRTAHG